MVDEKKCSKCDVLMTKKGSMNSGNAKFDIWECPACSNEEMVCSGINS